MRMMSLNLLNLTIKRNLLGELIMNKKIVMPKVFDEFATHFNLTKQQDEQGLDGALEEVYMMYMLGRSEFDDLEEYMRAHGDEEFYSKCVDALVNGYEVEK